LSPNLYYLMGTISKVAEDIINRSPFLREAMTENLINISALARKIKPELDAFFEADIEGRSNYYGY
jgi:hypothetical protein